MPAPYHYGQIEKYVGVYVVCTNFEFSLDYGRPQRVAKSEGAGLHQQISIQRIHFAHSGFALRFAFCIPKSEKKKKQKLPDTEMCLADEIIMGARHGKRKCCYTTRQWRKRKM